ncbi:hypothetical protein BW247_08945 [Acidihalobacter ferrooxydans]|uniref:RND transporter n=2 Tax=Acidihalobacter ferrooxydans TaxID=1765967 RepID=A0A1P8ULF1_9GAMM|nr:hypothetical protein BW247_08945 [Acidihalobacter ferrooxydans]
MLRRTAPAALAGLFAIGLAGCAVAPPYQAPHTTAPARYTATPLAHKTVNASGTAQQLTTGPAPAHWWRNFHSRSLDALIEKGFAQSPTLAASRATLRQYDYLARAAGAANFPSVGAGASGERQRAISQLTGQPLTYDTFVGQLNVSYNPDIFGALRYASDSAAAQAQAQRFELQAAYQTLAGNITTTALQAASYRAQTRAMQAILDRQRRALKLVKDKYRLGAAPYSDVLSQRSTVASTEASLAGLRQSLATSRHLLATLTGQYPADLSTDLPRLGTLTLPTKIPVSLPSDLVQARPDVQAAEAALRATYAKYGLAYAQRFPSFALTAAFGRGAPTIADLGKSTFNFWNIALNASATLFDAGALKDKSEAAKAAVAASAANYRSTVLQAFRQVADGLRALDNDAAALKARKSALADADAALKIVSNQYRLGGVDFQTLLTAQTTASQARIAYVQALAQRYADTAALYVALGGRAWPATDSSSSTTPPSHS